MKNGGPVDKPFRIKRARALFPIRKLALLSQGQDAERHADAFASAFLMSRSSVTAHASRNTSLPALVKMKAIGAVSVAALNRRLFGVGMTSDWQYQTLSIEIAKRGFRTVSLARRHARPLTSCHLFLVRCVRRGSVGGKLQMVFEELLLLRRINRANCEFCITHIEHVFLW